MLSHSNIDRADSQQVSKAPFTFNSTLLMKDSLLPTGGFISLKLYVEEGYNVPYRIHSIRPDGAVIFCDASGTPVATWQTYAKTKVRNNARPYISSLIYNMNGVIAGHVVCTHTVISVIRNVVETIQAPYLIPPDSFVLIPQCHVAMLKGQCKAIQLRDDNRVVRTTGDLRLTFATTDDCLWVTEHDKIQLNMINTKDKVISMLKPNGICSIRIAGGQTFNVDGCSIIIKANVESNVRVIKQNNSLIFKGVQSA